MTWKGFFEGIESIFVDFIFWPLDVLRGLELENWFLANIVSGIFTAIFFVAFFYWMGQLLEFNKSGEEDRSQTAHSFLG